MFSRLNTKLVTFKDRIPYRSYVVALFTNCSMVAAMLPIMAKLIANLRSECVKTWEFWHPLREELKYMIIMALKNTFQFCNHRSDSEDFSILTINNNDFKVTLLESLLINRNYTLLNKNKQFLPRIFLIAKEQSFIIW